MQSTTSQALVNAKESRDSWRRRALAAEKRYRELLSEVNRRPLDRHMDNLLAHCLGEIVRSVQAMSAKTGDDIDRGLILRRLLEEGGFEVYEKADWTPSWARRQDANLERQAQEGAETMAPTTDPLVAQEATPVFRWALKDGPADIPVIQDGDLACDQPCWVRLPGGNGELIVHIVNQWRDPQTGGWWILGRNEQGGLVLRPGSKQRASKELKRHLAEICERLQEGGD